MPWHTEEGHAACPSNRPWAVVKDDDGEVEGCHATQSSANDQMSALYASEDAGRMSAIPAHLLAPPDSERRRTTVTEVQWRASGDPNLKGHMTVRGHAAVFDQLSLDLGGFRERIAADAFDSVLERSPDVFLVWDHDTRRVLAGTNNGSLELRKDTGGLGFYARVPPFSYARDLQLAMDTGLINQASFAFTVARDDWEIDGEENITRTIHEVRDLYDVTITAMGAYPQTDSQLVRQLRSRLADEVSSGRLPQAAAGAITPVAARGGDSSHPKVGEGRRSKSHREEIAARANARRLELLRDLEEKGLWQRK